MPVENFSVPNHLPSLPVNQPAVALVADSRAPGRKRRSCRIAAPGSVAESTVTTPVTHHGNPGDARRESTTSGSWLCLDVATPGTAPWSALGACRRRCPATVDGTQAWPGVRDVTECAGRRRHSH